MSRVEVRFTGIGGQGVILASIIIGHAAILDGKHAAHTRSFGSESRGTAAWGHIVISEQPITYPMAIIYDVLVVMNSFALENEMNLLKKKGLLLVDEDLIKQVPSNGHKTHRVPATKLALENFGDKIFASMIMTGYLVKIGQIVTLRTAEQALKENVAVKTERNIEALRLGYKISKSVSGLE